MLDVSDSNIDQRRNNEYLTFLTGHLNLSRKLNHPHKSCSYMSKLGLRGGD